MVLFSSRILSEAEEDGWVRHDFANAAEERWFYIYNICGALAVISFVALIAGLFLGLLTLDALDLQIIQRSTIDDDERRYAEGLYPIVQKRHLLLVTLLILNALAYEALPIFLDALVPSWMAIILSTTLILLFGEILPSAIFTGPNQLMLGYHMIPIVRFFLFIMYPFARPCSAILDAVVHPEGVPGLNPEDEEEEAYNRGELAALVEIQFERRQKEVKKRQKDPKHRRTMNENKLMTIQTALHQSDMQRFDKGQSWGALKQEIIEAAMERREDDGNVSNRNFGNGDNASPFRLGRQKSKETFEPPLEQLNPPLVKQEVDLVVGALQMRTKIVMDVFTPLRLVYAIPDNLILDRDAMSEIYASGYSRVPVYHRKQRDGENGDEEDDTDQDKCNVYGFLMVRQLMLIDWEHERKVSTLPIQIPEAISPRLNLVEALKLLRTGGPHMAFVCARPDLANRALASSTNDLGSESLSYVPVEAGFMGVVTLEDVMESILQDRIYDESDIRDRERAVSTLTKWAAQVLQRFARRQKLKRLSASPHKVRQETTPLLQDVSGNNSYSGKGDNLDNV